jgi:small subunit ribosomal protein S17
VKERRRRLVGRVVSDKMTKTVVVLVEESRRHPLYRKVVAVRKKFYAHDENSTCRVGDTVRIVESRPLSRTKRWVVEEVIERSELGEEARVL